MSNLGIEAKARYEAPYGKAYTMPYLGVALRGFSDVMSLTSQLPNVIKNRI